MEKPGVPPDNYKWIVLGITTLGVLMFSIDITVVVLAVPTILNALQSNLINMVWVLISYTFVSTILLLALGRVADIYGRVRLYTIGFAVFTLGSLFCGLSQNDVQLIDARVVEGAGGALLLVNALAIITQVFPPNQRGLALGINSATFGAGAIIGPVLGGVILSVASWQWIFLINIPIGIVGTLLAYLFLREVHQRPAGEKLDVIGAFSFSIGLFGLLFALTEGTALGWTSPLVIGMAALFIVAIVFFYFWERQSRSPALDLRLFDSSIFDFSILAAFFQALAVFSAQFLIVYYLQSIRGNSPLTAALLLLPLPIVQSITGPFAGRLSDRIGARVPATTGLILQAIGIAWLSFLTPTTGEFYTAIGLALTGLGAGLFWAPNTSTAMSAAPTPRLGVASATLATFRNVGLVTSYALALAVPATSLPPELALQLFVGTTSQLSGGLANAFLEGMQVALRVSVVLALIAAGLSWARGPNTRSG